MKFKVILLVVVTWFFCSCDNSDDEKDGYYKCFDPIFFIFAENIFKKINEIQLRCRGKQHKNKGLEQNQKITKIKNLMIYTTSSLSPSPHQLCLQNALKKKNMMLLIK